jgi:hypothetical protein
MTTISIRIVMHQRHHLPYRPTVRNLIVSLHGLAVTPTLMFLQREVDLVVPLRVVTHLVLSGPFGEKQHDVVPQSAGYQALTKKKRVTVVVNTMKDQSSS